MNWKRILIGTWSWKRPFYSIASIYLSLSLYGCFMADSIIFQPPGTPYPEDRTNFITVKSGDQQITLYSRPAAEGMPTLLWSHGNAQNLSSLRTDLDALNLQGFGVTAYDYPGYGESSGKPTEKGAYQAAAAAYHHLTETLKTPADQIILVGQSVGSGPTCWLAAQHDSQNRGVVLISPFLSVFRIVTRVPILPGDRFPNLKWIKEFKTPLLVIHGENDQVIPFKDGKRLFELSPSPKKTFVPVPDAGHNDIFVQASFDFVTLLTHTFIED